MSKTLRVYLWWFSAAAAFGVLPASVLAQEDFIPEGETYVITNPSAWTRLRGEYAGSVGVEPFTVRGELGLFDYLTVGISYGGVDAFGSIRPAMNPRPGFQAKFRITNGGQWLPAVAVGYDDQGHGRYYDYDPYIWRKDAVKVDYDRYQFKAKGFYAVMSQEIEAFGFLGLHAGASYNIIEDKDDRNCADIFGSLEKGLGQHLVILAAANMGINDNGPASLGMNRGYLDAGVRWRVVESFNLEFLLTNLLENQTSKLGAEGGYARKLSLTYIGSF